MSQKYVCKLAMQMNVKEVQHNALYPSRSLSIGPPQREGRACQVLSYSGLPGSQALLLALAADGLVGLREIRKNVLRIQLENNKIKVEKQMIKSKATTKFLPTM